jgi:hypothetical protein
VRSPTSFYPYSIRLYRPQNRFDRPPVLSGNDWRMGQETLGFSLYCTDILQAIACGICSELNQLFLLDIEV